ncbi:MAG: S41 family peptidase [Saprospiraceae bacterium]|nr:S41 family peptidase [Saprospiraceae bacterium]
MKRTILIFAFCNFTTISFGQFPGSVDSLYSFIKSNSILRNKVDWKPIDHNFNYQITNSKNIQDTMKCFVSVLESLNDVHSQIYLKNQYFGHYPQFDDTTLAWIIPLNDKAILSTNQIYTSFLPNRIGYVRVPSFQVYDPKQINYSAQSLYDSINNIAVKKPKGFIIDLRLNGGGNIYPMLSGLSVLLGNNIIGYETDINDSIVRTWEIKNGNFIIGGYQATNISTKLRPKFQSIPIVVLIGPVSKSSGSMMAIAFKGRPNTYFIGEPTADGYTTSNGYFQFAPNLTLNFATNFVADRNKTVYKTVVNPDVIVHHGDNFEDLMKDEKIKLAIQWLTRK